MPWSVAVGGAGARPDEVEGLAIIVVKQGGEDRCWQARVVELDRKIRTAFLRDFAPARAEFCIADEHAVRWAVFGCRGFGNDSDVLGL